MVDIENGELDVPEELKDILETTYGDLLDKSYRKSKQFLKDLNAIEEKDGSDYKKLFIEQTECFTGYYFKKKANRRSKEKNERRK